MTKNVWTWKLHKSESTAGSAAGRRLALWANLKRDHDQKGPGLIRDGQHPTRLARAYLVANGHECLVVRRHKVMHHSVGLVHKAHTAHVRVQLIVCGWVVTFQVEERHIGLQWSIQSQDGQVKEWKGKGRMNEAILEHGRGAIRELVLARPDQLNVLVHHTVRRCENAVRGQEGSFAGLSLTCFQNQGTTSGEKEE